MLDTVRDYIVECRDLSFGQFYQDYIMKVQDVKLNADTMRFQSKVWSLQDVNRGDVVVSAIYSSTKEIL